MRSAKIFVMFLVWVLLFFYCVEGQRKAIGKTSRKWHYYNNANSNLTKQSIDYICEIS